jgi:hypothetical protein
VPAHGHYGYHGVHLVRSFPATFGADSQFVGPPPVETLSRAVRGHPGFVTRADI